MKELKLSNSTKVSLVDDEDYDKILSLNSSWSLSNGSVTTKVRNGMKRYTIHLHRFIMNVGIEHNIEVDHIDRDWLNNQKSNLRFATHSQNNMNKPSINSLGYKGIYFCPKVGRYYARIKVNRKRIGLGVYDSAIEAARAYNAGALKYHGEFAYINKGI